MAEVVEHSIQAEQDRLKNVQELRSECNLSVEYTTPKEFYFSPNIQYGYETKKENKVYYLAVPQSDRIQFSIVCQQDMSNFDKLYKEYSNKPETEEGSAEKIKNMVTKMIK